MTFDTVVDVCVREVGELCFGQMDLVGVWHEVFISVIPSAVGKDDEIPPTRGRCEAFNPQRVHRPH